MSNKPAQGLSVINRLKRFSAFWTTNHSHVFNQKTSASSPVLPNVRPLFCVLSFFRYQPQIQIKGFTESFLQTLTDPECLKIFSINGSQCANKRPSSGSGVWWMCVLLPGPLLFCCKTAMSAFPRSCWHYPDKVSGLAHHPGSLRAWQRSPLQISSASAFNSLIHLLGATGNHLTQDTAWGNKICRLPQPPAQTWFSLYWPCLEWNKWWMKTDVLCRHQEDMAGLIRHHVLYDGNLYFELETKAFYLV